MWTNLFCDKIVHLFQPKYANVQHIWLYFDRCEDFGLIEITKGTNSLDTECGKKPSIALIVGVPIMAIILVGALTFAIRKCQSRGKFCINLSILFYLAFKCFLIKFKTLVTFISQTVLKQMVLPKKWETSHM